MCCDLLSLLPEAGDFKRAQSHVEQKASSELLIHPIILIQEKFLNENAQLHDSDHTHRRLVRC